MFEVNYRRSLHVVAVEAIGEVPVQPGGDATRDGDPHAEHVDRDEDFVPQEISKSNEKIVLEHGGEGFAAWLWAVLG